MGTMTFLLLSLFFLIPPSARYPSSHPAPSLPVMSHHIQQVRNRFIQSMIAFHLSTPNAAFSSIILQVSKASLSLASLYLFPSLIICCVALLTGTILCSPPLILPSQTSIHFTMVRMLKVFKSGINDFPLNTEGLLKGFFFPLIYIVPFFKSLLR